MGFCLHVTLNKLQLGFQEDDKGNTDQQIIDRQKDIKTDMSAFFVFAISAQLFRSKLTGRIMLLKLPAMTFSPHF